MTISFKPEVTTNGMSWAGNALRFATEREAKEYATDLMFRWMAVLDVRVVPSDDPVNYRWVEGRGLERLQEVQS